MDECKLQSSGLTPTHKAKKPSHTKLSKTPEVMSSQVELLKSQIGPVSSPESRKRDKQALEIQQMETKYYEEMREGMRQRVDGVNQPIRYDKLYRSSLDDASLNEQERAELLKRKTIE